MLRSFRDETRVRVSELAGVVGEFGFGFFPTHTQKHMYMHMHIYIERYLDGIIIRAERISIKCFWPPLVFTFSSFWFSVITLQANINAYGPIASSSDLFH